MLVQDTAWPGYEEIPHWIMQGYTTLALVALEQMRALGRDRPTHIFLQAGVGSFAAAVLGFFTLEAAEAGVAAPLGKHIPGPDGPRGNRRSRRCIPDVS